MHSFRLRLQSFFFFFFWSKTSSTTIVSVETRTVGVPLRARIMTFGETGISVLAKTLIIMIMFIGQNPYSDMDNTLSTYSRER